MQPYIIQIAGGTNVHILNKETGRKRSLRLFFIRLKRSRMLIAYSVKIQDASTAQYTLYKIRRTGIWLKKADKDGGVMRNDDKSLVEHIKHEIDYYESRLGNGAYKILF